jgi:hypothetical protein
MSRQLIEANHHTPTIRTTLTRNLATLFEAITDEIKTSFEDNLDLKGNGETFYSTSAFPRIFASRSFSSTGPSLLFGKREDETLTYFINRVEGCPGLWSDDGYHIENI